MFCETPRVLTCIAFALQNIAIRRYLERRAKEKEEEERKEREREKTLAAAEQRNSVLDTVPAQKLQAAPEKGEDKKEKSKLMKWGRSKKPTDEAEEQINEAELYQSPRPAFCANARGTKRTQVPRDVAVPYFRFRKDRFYDWPPDPTVSRATPMLSMASVSNEDDGGVEPSDFDIADRKPFDLDKNTNNVRKRHTHHHHKKNEAVGDEADFGYGY
jgi:hypothetical protein